ncbi:hypothetical protein [Nocardia ignorata]|uniref:hypothetical protein n=1 Tax=Nocardia ignorata TaxID=145285 RepID=UPI00105C2AFA|nr:hypothetical protein [Nocardia ignorata]
MAKLRSLRRVIDETLRLWQTGPGCFRRAKHDTTLCGRSLLHQLDLEPDPEYDLDVRETLTLEPAGLRLRARRRRR